MERFTSRELKRGFSFSLRAPKAAEKAKLEEKFVMTRQSKKGVEKEAGKLLNGLAAG